MPAHTLAKSFPGNPARRGSHRVMAADYAAFLTDLKGRVRASQLRAAVSVNRELIALYWDVGQAIVERQRTHKWGDQVIARLARDLAKEFPQITGFSRQNLYRMRAFYLGYSPPAPIVAQPVRQLAKVGKKQFAKADSAIVAQAVRQLPAAALKPLARELKAVQPAPVLTSIPWGQNIVLLQKLKDPLLRLWYAHKTVEHGWSRAVLEHHIETRLHLREGNAINNFDRTLPPPQSDLAEQTLKDPYHFDFLTLRSDASERELEQGLANYIQKFLLELGVGFAFVGRQYHLEIGGHDYYLDLLFFHFRLRCYVVIELKMKPFEPEFAGKMNFYLSAVDGQLRHAEDRQSIGLLLCKERDRLTVDYALRDLKKPIGVAQWNARLVESLPKNLKGKLPTAEEIAAELSHAGMGRLQPKPLAAPPASSSRPKPSSRPRGAQ